MARWLVLHKVQPLAANLGHNFYMAQQTQDGSVQEQVVEQVKSTVGGMTYAELRKAVPQPPRDEFNREVVQALRAAHITIRAGRYVGRD